MNNYSGKWVWITGASQGMGREMAIQLAQSGAHLIISSRKKNDLEELKASLNSSGEVEIIPLDLERHEELDAMLEANRSLLDKVDILINNAGISQRSLTHETDFEVYKKLMDVNYLGTVKISLHMLDVYNKRGSGQFAVVSSIAGIFGTPYRSGYSASKMAIVGFFEALRAENKNTKIHITVIYPGFIHTNISKNALVGDGSNSGVMDDAQANGMSAEEASKKILQAIAQKKDELRVGGFREVHFAPTVFRFFPSLFKRILKRSKVR